jgi:hypothetical protein
MSVFVTADPARMAGTLSAIDFAKLASLVAP